MKSVFPLSIQRYQLRNQNCFSRPNVNSVFNGTETISFRGTKIWALVPDCIKKSRSLIEFKYKIKQWLQMGCTCRLYKVYIRNLGIL